MEAEGEEGVWVRIGCLRRGKGAGNRLRAEASDREYADEFRVIFCTLSFGAKLSCRMLTLSAPGFDHQDKHRVKAKLREGRCAASRINDVRAMDIVHDQLATGPKLRILTVVDTFSRFSSAVVPRFWFRGPDVVVVLERVTMHSWLERDTRDSKSNQVTSF